MLTKEQIIAIKKAAIATDPEKKKKKKKKAMGTQLHLLAQSNLVIRAEYEYVPNKIIVK